MIRSVVFEFQWSDEAEAHIARHGVKPGEVEEAAQRPFHTYPGEKDATILLGRTYAGRYLFVVLADSADGRYFPVTAYDMSEQSKREYRKKAR